MCSKLCCHDDGRTSLLSSLKCMERNFLIVLQVIIVYHVISCDHGV